jgi:hypothetical protein
MREVHIHPHMVPEEQQQTSMPPSQPKCSLTQHFVLLDSKQPTHNTAVHQRTMPVLLLPGVCAQVFKPGTKVNPYTGGSMKDFSVFTGAVSAKSLISAVTDTLDSAHITALSTAAEHEAFLQKEPKLAKVLLFTDKPASTVLAKAMSWAYARRLLFAEVRPAGGDGRVLAEQYMVEKYPTILVLKVGQPAAGPLLLGHVWRCMYGQGPASYCIWHRQHTRHLLAAGFPFCSCAPCFRESVFPHSLDGGGRSVLLPCSLTAIRSCTVVR